jgi:hypothetical protein
MAVENINKEVFEKAVRVALHENTKSSVMFLLRERLTREIIESAIPIITEPLVKRIAELEDQIKNLTTAPKVETPKSPQLSQLKEALSDIAEVIENPLNDK